jgi:hypothetical protein
MASVDKPTLDAVKFIAMESRKDYPQIGYDLFVRDYLPLLAKTPERGEDGKIIPRDMGPWMDICMHASNPVNVLNADGTVRFTVPPMIGTIPTYMAPPRSGISGIAITAMEKSNQHPVYGQRYLQNALKESLKDQPQFNGEQTKEWNNVLVEHGYSPLPGYPDHRIDLPKSDDKTTPAAAVAPARAISDDDYDDL